MLICTLKSIKLLSLNIESSLKSFFKLSTQSILLYKKNSQNKTGFCQKK